MFPILNFQFNKPRTSLEWGMEKSDKMRLFKVRSDLFDKFFFFFLPERTFSESKINLPLKTFQEKCISGGKFLATSVQHIRRKRSLADRVEGCQLVVTFGKKVFLHFLPTWSKVVSICKVFLLRFCCSFTTFEGFFSRLEKIWLCKQPLSKISPKRTWGYIRHLSE